MTRSPAELLLEAQLTQAGIPFVREVGIVHDRRYRVDFLVGTHKPESVMVEVEGATWSNGRHVRGQGFAAGCEKQYLAILHGWRYLRVTSEQVADGTALGWIRSLLGLERAA